MDAERRQTPSERTHEALMAALTKAQTTHEASTSITRNAKGDRQWDIVVRGPDIAECTRLAVEEDARLEALYPHSSTLPPAEPANGES